METGDRQISAKAILLLDRRNKILTAVRRDKQIDSNVESTRKQAIQIAYGISEAALRLWYRKREPNPRERLIETLCTHVNSNKESLGHGVELCRDDFSARVDKYQFGSKLGLNWQQVQQSTDAVLLQLRPLVLGFTLSEVQANNALTRFAGVYHTYHWAPPSPDMPNGVVRRSTLRVRYRIRLRSRHDYCIRARFNTPDPTSRNKYHGYYGVFSPTPKQLFWLFDQSRSAEDPDFAFIVANDERNGMIRGIYSTSSSEFQPYSSNIVIVRKKIDLECKAEVFEFMSAGPREYEAAEASVEELPKKQQEPIVQHLNAPNVID